MLVNDIFQIYTFFVYFAKNSIPFSSLSHFPAAGGGRFFARPFCKKAATCAAALFRPPVPTPRPYPWRPRLGRMPVPVGSEGGRPLYPRARRHALRTVCPLPRYPPPRPFRRRIPPRHGPRVAPTPPAVYAERQHRTCRRPRRGPVPAAAHLQGFSRGLFAKRPTTRVAALYLPHLPSSAPPRRGFPH